MQPPPLAGVRVLDFSHVFAGPFCTRNLADLGADVVHVETQSRPDKLGATQEQEDHRSAYAHRNKRSITINLKHEAGRALTLRLAAVADVAVENFSSRVMRNLGLDYETLQPLNPRLIYVSMSGYGHSGPRSSWTSMNMNLQAYSGLMMTTGAEGDPPTAISNSWNDYVGGLHAAVAVIEALAEREETRRGKNIDLSQFECSVGTLGPLVLSSAVNGSAPRRMGNRSSHAAPQGCYPCDGVDQWCTISVQTDQQWRALAEVIGQPSLAREARFGTLIGRMRGHDEIDQRLSSWTMGLPAIDVEQRLNAVGVPAQRARRVDEVAGAPDIGRVFHPLQREGRGPILVAGIPLAFSDSDICQPNKPGRIGQHTPEALRDWLNLSDDEIRSLEDEGALR